MACLLRPINQSASSYADHLKSALLLLLLILSLAGCSGGGGGGSTKKYTVSATAGDGGSISPGSQSVARGTTASFTVTHESGYSIDSVSGCGGSLSGNIYTTGAISAACTVTATFAPGGPAPAPAPAPAPDPAPAPAPALAAPEDVVATAGYRLGLGTIEISWSAVTNATGYRVYWGEESGVHPETATVTETSHQLTNLTPDQTYYLVVAATAPGGTGPASVEVSATPETPVVTQNILNDTGIYWWADGSTNFLEEPQADYPGQDADFGRDAEAREGALAKVGGGAAGFDFTRLGANGEPLAIQDATWSDAGDEASGTRWSCVRDNRTGLIWEIKVNDASHLRHKGHTYTWYNSDGTVNGGSTGTANGGSCIDEANCDTEKFIAAVNSTGLCGADDWRLPNRQELMSIVHNGRYSPAIDPDYFPNTPLIWLWSSSTRAKAAGDHDNAWKVEFKNGDVYWDNKGSDLGVRLVRAGQ
ncbi:Lcl domain-containing protein [Desulfurivibrio alkaliphilus]|uniref:Fibronectin type III domain protein n=1 Tax=Desulfurivibrio alkaliphilus (strain DSM 19089 / UNIQEM U267 / AHT2) TaxID=589865 RepID=D6Z0F4_DESAT|nr:DUF1566 domain-containing protein [Desulfurivibrio alkaliphilus]ADH85183.1 Fibronectin type III domain protein [Desulfurivibrio alkaliphilus AHT 2]